MEKYGIRFFTRNTTNHRFKDEGLPYGPIWSTEKIREHLKKPVFEDSSYGAFEATSAFECITEKEIQDWQAVMSPYRVALTEPTYEENILLEQDKLELTKDNSLRYCGACYQFGAQTVISLYPKSFPCCNMCAQREDLVPTNGITVDKEYRRQIEAIIPPSAKFVYLERLSNSTLDYSKVLLDEGNPTVHIISTSFADEILEENSVEYAPRFHRRIDKSSFIDEEMYEEHMMPQKIKAVLEGNSELLKQLVTENGYLGPIGVGGRTPLCVASERGDIKMVKCILDLNAKVDEQTYTGFTPLLCALLTGQNEVVELLLKHKASIDFSRTALKVNLPHDERMAELKIKLEKLELSLNK